MELWSLIGQIGQSAPRSRPAPSIVVALAADQDDLIQDDLRIMSIRLRKLRSLHIGMIGRMGVTEGINTRQHRECMRTVHGPTYRVIVLDRDTKS